VSPPKDWLLPSADTIAIYYYYSARKLILILLSHGGWKAESTWALQYIWTDVIGTDLLLLLLLIMMMMMVFQKSTSLFIQII